jgi:hypothetical protein
VAVKTITVADLRELEMTIANYSAAGFYLVNKTETSAVLRKPKEFNVLLAILGFLFCVIGLIVYAIIYTMQQDQVIEIRLVERQAALPGASYTFSDDRRWWWDGRQWQDTQQSLPPGIQRSDDGAQWWDGTTWRPVPASERRWSGTSTEPPTDESGPVSS